jgi:dTDP-4-dehydrorhamnose reductase
MGRVLITGSNGLVGQKLVELLSHSSNYSLILASKQSQAVFENDRLTYRQLDISERSAVRKIVDEFEPEVIVNAAAMTDVDRCETARELAWKSNVVGVENIVHSAKLVGARVIHLSTDYVFDGKNGPYDERARPNPLSYYGRTKLAGENILQTSGIPFTIVRTMVLYGIAYGAKMNFALWVLRSLSEGSRIRAVDDQIGNPTFADDLAHGLTKIIELERTGLYHIAGPDIVSRYEFALAIARAFDFDPKLISPEKTAAMKQPAPRPLKSGFITLKADTELGIKMSGMKQGIAIFKNQVKLNMKAHSHH